MGGWTCAQKLLVSIHKEGILMLECTRKDFDGLLFH